MVNSQRKIAIIKMMPKDEYYCMSCQDNGRWDGDRLFSNCGKFLNMPYGFGENDTHVIFNNRRHLIQVLKKHHRLKRMKNISENTQGCTDMFLVSDEI